MNDRNLLRRIRSGDSDAFEALIDRHQASLLRYAAHHLGDADRAEDAVQEAFMALLEQRDRLDGIESIVAWLFRVTRNRALDLLKKETRMRRREGSAAVAESTLQERTAVEYAEEEQAIVRQLASLDEDVREVLLLKVNEGRSYREIATITSFSLGKVSKLIHRGLSEVARGLRASGVM